VAQTNTGSTKEASAAATGEAKAPARRRITRRKAVETHIRSYFDALARRDVRAAVEHWREDGVEDQAPAEVLRGRAEIERFMRELFASGPDAAFSLTRIVAGEREAAVEWRLRGTFSGAPFQGIEPTGKPFDLRGVDYFEVEDGLIVSNVVYYDGAEYARQIGMLPPRNSGAERAMTSAFNTVTKLRRAIDERRGG
jgi:steroid delta-isomerase-like uncharacterized protein